jgi:hypothetical protein
MANVLVDEDNTDSDVACTTGGGGMRCWVSETNERSQSEADQK